MTPRGLSSNHPLLIKRSDLLNLREPTLPHRNQGA